MDKLSFYKENMLNGTKILVNWNRTGQMYLNQQKYLCDAANATINIHLSYS